MGLGSRGVRGGACHGVCAARMGSIANHVSGTVVSGASLLTGGAHQQEPGHREFLLAIAGGIGVLSLVFLPHSSSKVAAQGLVAAGARSSSSLQTEAAGCLLLGCLCAPLMYMGGQRFCLLGFVAGFHPALRSAVPQHGLPSSAGAARACVRRNHAALITTSSHTCAMPGHPARCMASGWVVPPAPSGRQACL